MKWKFLLTLLICSVYIAKTQESTMKPLEVVPSVDLSRYVGTWYEIARLPNRFQEKCEGNVTATYSLLENGEIKVINSCLKSGGETTQAEGLARRASTDEPNTKLKVRFAPAFLSFLPFVWGNYWIIDLAPDYGYAVIGEPDRDYLWILARTPTLEETLIQQILAKVVQQGYDTTDLIRTKQLWDNDTSKSKN